MRLHLAPTLIALAASLAACSGPATSPDGEHDNTVSAEPAPLDPAAPAEEKAALASCSPVTVEGYCGVAFGMAPSEAIAKFPVKLEKSYDESEGAVQPDPNRCYEMFATEPVQGVSFMVENQKVSRIDFLTEAAKTAEGFGIGSTAAEIKAKFPAASEAPNKYEPEVTDLTVARGPAKFVFEVRDGKVSAWRAGIAPTIDYTELCG